MMKTTRSSDKSAPSRNNGSRSVSNENDDSKKSSCRKDSNDKADRFSHDDIEHAQKLGKLKDKNLSKFQKFVMSGKK